MRSWPARRPDTTGGGGFAAAHPPGGLPRPGRGTRRATGYGAAPPASRLLRIACGDGPRGPGLDPGDHCGPAGQHTRARPQACPSPAARRARVAVTGPADDRSPAGQKNPPVRSRRPGQESAGHRHKARRRVLFTRRCCDDLLSPRVENRCCLESVEADAAWSGSVHPNVRTLGGSSHGCSVHCRYSKYMTVMKSDCQPVSAAGGSAAERRLVAGGNCYGSCNS
jgi:hypothetical protein